MRPHFLLLLVLLACDASEDDSGGPPLPDTSENVDLDGDDWTVGEGDCNDGDPAVNPGATEIACDFIDNDCQGGDLADQDRDGHNCEEVGGDDCNDLDAGTHPGISNDTCGDFIDRDCDGDDECDCDGDGWDTTAKPCGGRDCDDTDPGIHPNADDDVPDGVDDDCDGEVDEDAHCNPWVPTANGPEARRTYATLFEGTDCTEVVTITAWDDVLGLATVSRHLTDPLGGTREAQEAWTCAGGVLSVTGFAYLEDGEHVANVTYDAPRRFLLDPGSMAPGEDWSYQYTASDADLGDLWITTGQCVAMGLETVEVAAGTFDALVIEDTYAQHDLQFGTYDAQGTATLWYVRGLGLVRYEDRDPKGDLQESRELESYSGFYP